jgi:DNA-directed RNA polymerase alpha subunit
LKVGSRIRRSRLNDLAQTAIVSIELEGASHEFSRLPGVREPVLELLFQFRALSFSSPSMNLEDIKVIPFYFVGPGTFYAKDIILPTGIKCRNQKRPLVTISSGYSIRGRCLVRKSYVLSTRYRGGQIIYLGEPWLLARVKPSEIGFEEYTNYPWLSLGFPVRPVQRVRFRIEWIGQEQKRYEILIFEIITNGRLSPRQALYEASTLLSHEFSSIARVTSPSYLGNVKFDGTNFYKKATLFSNKWNFGKTPIRQLPAYTFYNLFSSRFSQRQEPLGLDLGNVELTKEIQIELNHLGFQTLGQLLERLVFDSNIFSYGLKKQSQWSLFQLGFFPF